MENVDQSYRNFENYFLNIFFKLLHIRKEVLATCDLVTSPQAVRSKNKLSTAL